MRREALTAKLSAFEGKADVHTWQWHGWHPWPVLRTHLLLALHGETSAPIETPRFGSRVRSALAWRRKRRQRSRRFARQAHAPDTPTDVVFLTQANRSEPVGGQDYNTVVDPWNEALVAGDHRVTVWDLGDPAGRALPGHSTIQAALDQIRSEPEPPVEPAPAWFLGLADFVSEELDAEVSWREVWRDLCLVEAFSQRYGEWLATASPKSLLLDCWYVPECLGAALAAHRLGIPVIDLQHGIQGHAHPAYAGWSRPPQGGYETFPDRFWVWGDWDAQSLLKNNPGTLRDRDVRVVGNPWIADWSTLVPRRGGEEAAEATPPPGTARTVLVTLQKGVPFREHLVDLVRNAPLDWHWWIRLHRNMRERAPILEQELQGATGRPVEVERATALPLYALLRNASWHVTAFSTCALEAMAFGVPTLLTDASGAHAYDEFVKLGAMHTPSGLEARLSTLSRDPARLAETCRRGARRCVRGAGLARAPRDRRGHRTHGRAGRAGTDPVSDRADGPRVDVAIVTCRRPEMLGELLACLEDLTLPAPTPRVRIVVVDNDPAAVAAPVVAAAAERSQFPYRYLHEKRQGIPFARNAALGEAMGEAEFLAFIDDDESPDADWLTALLHAQRAFDADVVTGASHPRFESAPPAWIPESGFFDAPTHADGARLSTAYTNNVLVRLAALEGIEPLFDERLALTGSSDSEFFARVAQAGARIVWSARACTHERIGPSRARLGWILQRSFRHGNAAQRIEGLHPDSARPWAVRVGHGLWCLARGLGETLFAVTRGPGAWVAPLGLAATGLGRLCGAFGWVYEEYRQIRGR